MTVLIKTVNELKSKLSECNKPLGFIPTMGSLHDGHISLIKVAKDECKTLVLSNFVNKLQFGQGEDFEKYPRDIESDLKICEDSKVDIMFVPSHEEIYPNEEIEIVTLPVELTDILCGKTRKTHFQGVATVLHRLFNIVNADFVYFGEKDLQQLYVVRWLVANKSFSAMVRSCPIIRESNGLACSTRNKYLTKDEKDTAANIYKALKLAKGNVRSGIFTPGKATLESLVFLSKIPKLKVEYFEAKSKNDLSPVSEKKVSGFYFLTAVHLSGIRLIDNIEV